MLAFVSYGFYHKSIFLIYKLDHLSSQFNTWWLTLRTLRLPLRNASDKLCMAVCWNAEPQKWKKHCLHYLWLRINQQLYQGLAQLTLQPSDFTDR